MVRVKAAAKAAKKKDKGTYGKLNLSMPTQSQSKSKTPDKNKQPSSLRQAKTERKGAKKSKSSSLNKPNKPKAKTKHHVAKFPRNSIKQRMNLVADTKQSTKNENRLLKQRRQRKSKRPKRMEFQLNITDSNHDYFLRPENVPWFKAEEQARFRDNYTAVAIPSGKVGVVKTDKTSDDQETLQLPSNQVLCQIDAEIQSFSAYVKLTPSERKARSAFLSHITEILTTQFSNRGKGRYMGYRQQQQRSGGAKGENEDEIYVEPFGSYATQEVCTFASDVDMCLWGLVKEEEKPNTHLKFVSSDSNEADDVEDNPFVLNDQRGGCPLLTESSLLRTMDAINSAQTRIKRQNDKKAAATSEGEPGPEVNSGDDCLFVIDRVGVGMSSVADEEKKAVDDAIVQYSETEASSDLKLPKRNEQASDKESISKKKNTAREQFQFVIDVDGVQELGGDPQDLPGFSNEHATSEEKESDTRGKEAVDVEIEASVQNQTNSEASKSVHNNEDYSKQGKLYDKAINVDDDKSDSDDNAVIVIDDDSADEADKLESFYSRQTTNENNKSQIQSPHKAAEHPTFFAAAAAAAAEEEDVISVGDSSEYSEDAEEIRSMENGLNQKQKQETLELSITSNEASNSADASKPVIKPVFGPTGKTRVRVISVLQGLTGHLRRSSFTNTVECRSRARVPIVNCNTRTGFEGDIAIGGHNGMDTSTYAKRQVNRFQSFAPIVLVLKVLMVQQGLDKPFTGGLGSYKLYVLVAHHIESHLANGGSDRPSEILISLLFRYSCVGSPNDKCTTDLECIRDSEGLIASDDGVCDLAPVFRIPDVVEMFRECHERLFDRMLLAEAFDGDCSDNLSYLSSVIDCFRLKEARESSDRRSRLSDDITRPTPRDHPGKVNASRRVGKVFSKHEHASDTKRQMNFSENESNKRRRSYNDVSFNAQQQKRGPRGGLIPLHRPDLVAKRQLKANPDKELLLKGTKNRKNKKKQTRDEALRAFSRRSI